MNLKDRAGWDIDSETKWTPGPWELDCGGLAIIRPIPRRTPSADWIATLDTDSIPVGEARANACLMHAAPEMYEVLASIENDDGAIPDRIWKKRNAAIAKARGKEADDESR
jgi:hypothetical protein